MEPCRVSDERNNNVTKFHVDQNEYLHALKLDHTCVPACTSAKYILKGYVLPHMPQSYYIKAIFQPNNELINVWTHLIPGLYFIKLLFRYNESMDLLENWPLLLTIVSSITVMLCSALMHTFHSRSEYDHACWMMLDFYGIIFYAFGSTVAHFYACSELNYYQTIGWLNLVVFFINCSSVFAFCCNSKVGQKSSDTFISRFLRLGSVAGGYIYGHIPLVYRLYSSGIDEAMFYHIISTLCLTTAAIIYAVDFPQRWYIGKFDIIGQSHQIFHILSAFCCYFDILAVEQDVLNRERYWGVLSQQADMLSLWHVCIAAVLLTISCVIYASNRLINHRDRIGHCCCYCCHHEKLN